MFQRGVNAWVKLDAWHGGRIVLPLLRFFGRSSRPIETEDRLDIRTAAMPENAYRGTLARWNPDVVVVSSVSRAAWRWINGDVRRTATKAVLYVREDHAITHFTVSKEYPDLVLANATAHVARLEEAGVPALFLPSVVDRRDAEVCSSRRCALFVNPVAENHPDLVFALAELRPDIPFVFQESWPLDEPAWDALRDRADALPNVELRHRTTNARDVYRDAKLLVAPYPSGRPRVIPEAQHNGIPVLGANQPALAEAVGPGGCVVSLDETPAQWAAALAQMWDDDEVYQRLSRDAVAHDRRPELDPDRVVESFERALASLSGR
ncbi:MAG TPA: glycosyltransferase [Acidimicrobiia bacterium]|nr:glycosyltransferase [Acidimicrobiia bacterium]